MRGAVVWLDGNPISEARVEAPMWGVAALSRADGTFNLNAVPTGTQLLMTFITSGSMSTRVTVNVTRRQPVEIRVTLGPSVNVLDPVLVTARRNYALDKDGFTARRRAGWGKYFTSTDIEKRNPQYLSDMLTAVPGIQVDHRPGGATISTTEVWTRSWAAGRPSACPSVLGRRDHGGVSSRGTSISSCLRARSRASRSTSRARHRSSFEPSTTVSPSSCGPSRRRPSSQ